MGRGIDLENLVDLELDGESARPLEQLGTWIVQNVPSKRLSLARAFPFIRHPLAVELAKQTTIQNGAIGLVFFVPGADMPLIALNQAKMVLQIAAVYGKEMSKERLGEVLAVMAGGFGCRAVARQLVARAPCWAGPSSLPLPHRERWAWRLPRSNTTRRTANCTGSPTWLPRSPRRRLPSSTRVETLSAMVVSSATAHD